MVLDRFRTGRYPLAVDPYTLPKSGTDNGLRIISCLDPFDEVSLRVYVGRVASMIERHRDPDRVLAYPLVKQPPKWCVGSHKAPIARRKELTSRLLSDPTCIGRGTLDIEDFYRSVDPGLLERALLDLRSPEGAVAAISQSLIALREVGGPGGLPIGFEGSGLLSNAFLYPLDQHLLVGPPFLRYSDDVWVFPRRGDDWDDLKGLFERGCSWLRLRPNQEKALLCLKSIDPLRQVLADQGFESFTDSGDDERIDAHEAIEVLELALEDQSPDWQRVRYALGGLSSARSTLGIRVLQSEPRVFEEEPLKVGTYLTALALDASVRDEIDHDWLIGEATRSSGPRGLARQLHACRALSHLHTSKDHGEHLHDLAVTMEEGHRHQPPLQSWAATAWAASEAWRADPAIATAEHIGSLHVRRALCLSFAKSGRNAKKAPTWRRKLTRLAPDLEPTLQFAFD